MNQQDDKEVAEAALLAAISVPQELECLNATAAKKVRFALYGLRQGLVTQYPGVMSVRIKVKDSCVYLEPNPQKILIRRKGQE